MRRNDVLGVNSNKLWLTSPIHCWNYNSIPKGKKTYFRLDPCNKQNKTKKQFKEMTTQHYFYYRKQIYKRYGYVVIHCLCNNNVTYELFNVHIQVFVFYIFLFNPHIYMYIYEPCQLVTSVQYLPEYILKKKKNKNGDNDTNVLSYL